MQRPSSRATMMRAIPTLALLLAAACGGKDKAAAGSAAAIPGIVGDTISVGALLPLSDNVALIGKPILAGVQGYFNQLNQKGGVGGKYKVKVLAEDITYANPSTSVQKFNKIKDQVVGFVPILGTDHINVTLPLLAESNMLAVPSTFDAEWVREPHLVPMGAPYQLQIMNGVDYWAANGGKGKVICAMVMATGYGSAALEGAEYAAKALGTTVAVTTKFRPGDQDFVAPVTQLKNGKCDAVAFASLPTETAKIMGTAAQLGFTPRWIATSPSWHMVLGKSPIAPYATAHLWVSVDAAAFGDTTQAGMVPMMQAFKAQLPDGVPDFYFTAGYTFAQSMDVVLEEAAKQGDLSRAGLAKALTSLGTVSFGGLFGDYTYGAVDTREPPRATNILAIDPAAPGGFGMVAVNHQSPTAKDFVFTKKR
jgi:ABC-type branched-subunit amino acid transport system substrate-binding protein